VRHTQRMPLNTARRSCRGRPRVSFLVNKPQRGSFTRSHWWSRQSMEVFRQTPSARHGDQVPCFELLKHTVCMENYTSAIFEIRSSQEAMLMEGTSVKWLLL